MNTTGIRAEYSGYAELGRQKSEFRANEQVGSAWWEKLERRDLCTEQAPNVCARVPCGNMAMGWAAYVRSPDA